MAEPSQEHEARVMLLEDLAMLGGFTDQVPRLIRGVGTPDVARFNPLTGGLFLGDGKFTESPGNTNTMERLSRYSNALVRWHRQTGCSAIFGICFTNPGHTEGWWRVANRLTLALVPFAKVIHKKLSTDENVILCTVPIMGNAVADRGFTKAED
jgi:hypothetical protein